MMDRLNLYRPIYLLLIAVSGLITALSYLADPVFFYILGSIWLITVVFAIVRSHQISRDNERYFSEIRRAIYTAKPKSVGDFPMPTIFVRESGDIVWYNDSCRDKVIGDDMYFKKISDLIPDVDFNISSPANGINVTIKGHMYTMFTTRTAGEHEPITVIYLIDDHDFKSYTKEFFESRPHVLTIVVDNYSELFQNSRENERSRIIGELEKIIEGFADENHGMVKKLEQGHYVAVIEDRYMRQIIAKRFEILDAARKIETADRVSMTLSIGVGSKEGDLHEAELLSRQALDMSLGRGGDQAAVKSKNGYEFYGGISKGIEKRNKVRTRIVANAISEIVASSENVLIMGHRFADLDCLGSAIGVYSALKPSGRPCNIVLDTERNLADSLYQRMLDAGYKDVIISPEQALLSVTRDTLLIIVDTHVLNILESPELYNKCQNVVVIDHHRKMVDHISNAIIFFHEPYASSASEMAAELCQYFWDGKLKITVPEAEAMLAGIMLDTRNFTLRTGVRTFEAAAYLRKMGADTVEVRKLFASSMEAYQQKSRLVSSADLYRNCAITYAANSGDEDIRIAAPQAADDLLNISDVSASFVMYETNDGVSISARSMGDFNVQVIMEKLGGGGHQTMAGAQLTGISLEDTRRQLLAAIDQYCESLGRE